MSDPSSPPDLNECSKEQLIEVVKGFQELLKSPSAREKFVDKASGGNPKVPHWAGDRHKMPYYKPKFARMVQITVDEMIKGDRRPRVFRYDSFKYNTESTLYNKVYQGFLFLIDNLDPDLRYAKAKDDITILKAKDGIRLEFIDLEINNGKDMSVPVEDGPVNKREWKSKLQDFIDNSSEEQKLQIKNVSLTKDEMEECEMMLAGLEASFIHRISGTEILVLHIKPEEESTPNENQGTSEAS